MKATNIFIDGIEVDYLVNSKMYYTWFKMIDGTEKRVSSFEYARESGNRSHGRACVLVSE